MKNLKLKILIICSKNSGYISPFITEQVDALIKSGVSCEYFPIQQKGFIGYLRSRKSLLKKIDTFKPDIIHAHFGLSGVLANLQHKIPVVTTYHGCDINKWNLRIISIFSLLLSKHNIFVSKGLYNKVTLFKNKSSVIACGVDFETFYHIDKEIAKKQLGWGENKKAILFSSNFDRIEKNAALSFEAMKLLPDYELIELKGFSRKEVNLLMNACDVGLLSSIREGSPMFIKELIASDRPIVSTNVGDVNELIGDVKGSYVVSFDKDELAAALKKSIQFDAINYSETIKDKIANKKIVKDIIAIYQSILKNKAE